MLTGSFRKRGRICWYVVDGIRRKRLASTVYGGGRFLCTRALKAPKRLEICQQRLAGTWRGSRGKAFPLLDCAGPGIDNPADRVRNTYAETGRQNQTGMSGNAGVRRAGK